MVKQPCGEGRRAVQGEEASGEASRRRIWLASYPRSGNTLLRCILNGCFGVPSTSVYGSADLGRNAALERNAGHFNPAAPPACLTGDMPWLVKTHRRPPDAAPAIYVVRDPREATVSLWEFNHRRQPLRAIISGQVSFGTWSSHVAAWHPLARPNTLMLRYEEMVGDLPAALERLSGFLDLPVVSQEPPSRAEIAAIDGRWVRELSDWRCKIAPRDIRLLEAVNGEIMSMLGYNGCSDRLPPAAGGGDSGRRRPAYEHPPSRLAASWVVACWHLRGRVRRRVARLIAPLRRRLARFRIESRRSRSGPE